MQIGIMHSEALEDDKNENKLQCKKQDNSGFLWEYHIYEFLSKEMNLWRFNPFFYFYYFSSSINSNTYFSTIICFKYFTAYFFQII